MKFLLDRSDIDKAIDQCVQDGHIPKEYDKAKLSHAEIRKKFEQELGIDQDELMKDLREVIATIYNDAS